jgi:ribonuclease HII
MYSYENDLLSKDIKLICGVDEVGRGPLAGPVVAAAVILNPDDEIEGLNDSKKLSQKKRMQLFEEIKKRALAYSYAFVSEKIIDEINIYQASKKAMIEAIKKLNMKPEYVLSDAMPLKEIDIPHIAIIKGDTLSATIAAASIVAKETRDSYMIEMDKLYPGYNFKKHKGYPTKEHLEALKKLGVCEIHRKTYKPIKKILSQQLSLELEE